MSWKWILRPRWLLLVGAVACFFAWLFWPVRIFPPYLPVFLAVSEDGEREFLGSVSPRVFDDPWRAALEFESRRNGTPAPQSAGPELGGEAFWLNDKLQFRTANVVWEIDPVNEFRDKGEAAWKADVEGLARRTIDNLFAGRVERADLTRVPRVILWIGNRWEGWQKKVEKWFE